MVTMEQYLKKALIESKMRCPVCADFPENGIFTTSKKADLKKHLMDVHDLSSKDADMEIKAAKK